MRRTAVARSAIVALVALLAPVGCSSGTATTGSASTGPASTDPASSTRPGPATASSSPSGSGSPYAVELVVIHPDGDPTVRFTVTLTGDVPRQKDPASGTLIPASDTQVLGTYVQWGDGGTNGTDAGDVECATGGELVPVRADFEYSHTFLEPGTYTVTFTAGACPTPTETTRTFTVTVP